MVLSTKQKWVLAAGATLAMSPLVVWGISAWTIAAAVAAVVGFGVAAGAVMGRKART
jgi:predicted membrane metal-binding protein